jgi:transposase
VPSRFEITDELWAEVEPLIPPRVRRRRNPGRRAIDDRLVLNGIPHVLHTGIAWEDLPCEYGYGSGGHLLAAAADLAEGRCVGCAAPKAAGEAERCGQDRLVPSGR